MININNFQFIPVKHQDLVTFILTIPSLKLGNVKKMYQLIDQKISD